MKILMSTYSYSVLNVIIIRMAGNVSNKIAVLQLIKQNKDVLFGAFSAKLTKRGKSEKWKEIHEVALSQQLIANNKDWQYCRDTVRKRTMAKLDNAKKTGSAGGTEAKLQEIDHIVLDIIGKESPLIREIGVPDSLGLGEVHERHETDPIDINDGVEQVTEHLPTNIGVSDIQLSRDEKPRGAVSKPRRWITENSVQHERYMESETLKKKKVEPQVDYLEHDIYKKKLEILEMEQKLGLEGSKFTKELVTLNKKDKYVQIDTPIDDNIGASNISYFEL